MYGPSRRSKMTGSSPFEAPKAISGVIEKVVRSLGLSDRYHGWQVVTNWEEIVGETVARVAVATRFEDGVLYVAVADDAWRQELAMQTDSILEKIRTYPYGKGIKQLRLVRGKKGT